MSSRVLNVLQVCDHLGWEGSRMHGVKRLFGWMIPRFDRDRFRVSLVSLRKKDLSEETLDTLGVDITYLERSKFDPRTLPALLRIVDARQELGIAPGGIIGPGGISDFAVGSVTRLHESKGNSYLIDAAARVVRERPAARFFLVGEGPLLGDLQAQASALGLGDRFVFAGFRRDIARTLSAFDLVVFPSLWEGTPLTVFETLAMGKPVVATDADGLVDVLTDGGDAIIVPKRDTDALAGAIERAIDDPAARRRLGDAARVTGRQYDIALFVRKMERLYVLLHETSRATRRQ